MSSAWDDWKKKNAERQRAGVVRPWDVLNPETEHVTDEVQKSRYALCEKCPHFLITKQCSKCGCFMPAKTTMKHATCPIDKW
jgi:hypothetical protein